MEQTRRVGVAKSERPRLTNGEIILKNSNLCDHNSPTSQTDGRTDRQTTCDRNTALCTKVHRAVIKMVSRHHMLPVRTIQSSDLQCKLKASLAVRKPICWPCPSRKKDCCLFVLEIYRLFSKRWRPLANKIATYQSPRPYRGARISDMYDYDTIRRD